MKIESILKDFFLTILTLGFWNLYVQFRQIEDINEIYSKKKYSLSKTVLYSVFTFGLYFCYHEYTLTLDIQEKTYGVRRKLTSLWVLIATFLGIWPAVDSYQQAMLNVYKENRKSLSLESLFELFIIGFIYTTLVTFLIVYMLSNGEINHPLEFFL